MIKNIVFDYGNVLIRFKPEEELRKYTNSDEEASELKNMIYLSKPWKDGDRGLLSREESISALCETYPQRAKLLRTVMCACSDWLTMPENIPPFLDKLRIAGYSLYYISNTNPKDYETIMQKHPALRSIPGVASFKEHILKPELAVFSIFLDRFSLQAPECLFIDDMAENTAAAAAFGFQTLTLTAGAETLPETLIQHEEIGRRLAEKGLIHV